MVVSQYSIYWVSLDPTQGAEMQKTRPCVVLTPNEMNQCLRTVQIAPITSTLSSYPWRVDVTVQKRPGKIALDHIRAIDKSRLHKKIATLTPSSIDQVQRVIQEMLVD